MVQLGKRTCPTGASARSRRRFRYSSSLSAEFRRRTQRARCSSGSSPSRRIGAMDLTVRIYDRGISYKERNQSLFSRSRLLLAAFRLNRRTDAHRANDRSSRSANLARFKTFFQPLNRSSSWLSKSRFPVTYRTLIAPDEGGEPTLRVSETRSNKFEPLTKRLWLSVWCKPQELDDGRHLGDARMAPVHFPEADHRSGYTDLSCNMVQIQPAIESCLSNEIT